MAEPASGADASLGSSETSSARRKTPFGLAITVAGRYRRGACIAKGGSSTVHRAIDQRSGAEVALKSFHVHRAFDPALLPSLETGRAIAAQLGPDVMVPILDLGADDDGTPFVIMPIVEGETLGARLDRAGRIEPREALAIARRALEALDALHGAGVTHGDPSPDNLLVRADGRVLLLDHEGLDAIGAPRAARTTEGFGRSGGTREARDDHRALAAITAALVGDARPAFSDASIDRFITALRAERLEDARAALGWTTERGATVTQWTFGTLAAVGVLLLVMSLLLLLLLLAR
ncbi:MAG: hypothetical protein K1X94_26545 [Sandaracinaceae bacterium]|nr:hypothetical protein [Sandaracinaceae bacterium]